jgi:NAD(P)-dependent dehydrogenase (short-subunit alcohol dehydrogenase family)
MAGADYSFEQGGVMNIDGLAVLVTGASKGLGRSTAEALAKKGAKVVLVARNAEEVEGVAARLRAEGLKAWAIAADVGDKNAIYPLAGAAASLAGPIEVVIHNASTLGPTPLRYLMDSDCEDLERVIAVNLLGPFRLTKAIAGSMMVRRRGLVIQISSDAAVNAYPKWGIYGVSKAAADHLTRTFAAEFEGTGVKFWSLDPGEMDTQMHADAIPDADPRTLRRPQQVADAIVRLIAEETLASGVRAEVSV